MSQIALSQVGGLTDEHCSRVARRGHGVDVDLHFRPGLQYLGLLLAAGGVRQISREEP